MRRFTAFAVYCAYRRQCSFLNRIGARAARDLQLHLPNQTSLKFFATWQEVASSNVVSSSEIKNIKIRLLAKIKTFIIAVLLALCCAVLGTQSNTIFGIELPMNGANAVA